MRWLTLSTALLGLCATLLSASQGTAEAPEIRRHGAACPPTGCPTTPRSGSSAGIGFAAAVLATGLAARRLHGTPR